MHCIDAIPRYKEYIRKEREDREEKMRKVKITAEITVPCHPGRNIGKKLIIKVKSAAWEI